MYSTCAPGDKMHVMAHESDQKISPAKLSRLKHIPACRSVFLGLLVETNLGHDYLHMAIAKLSQAKAPALLAG